MAQSFLRGVALAAAMFTLTAPLGAQADTSAGAYLAGRHALISSDFDRAANYYTRALARDRENPNLMEQVVLSQLALGRIDKALPVAKLMESMQLRSQVAHMVVIVDLIENGQFEDLLSRDPETLGTGPLVDGLVNAWAHMGAGSVAKALEQFDVVAEQKGLHSFALYQKALALASVGDFEGAEAIFADESKGLSILSRGAAIARAQILSQLERNDDAIAFLTNAFGTRLDPGLQDVADRLAAGERLPFEQVTSVQDGMAEVFFSIGQALHGEASDDYVLVYIRAASYLRPEHVDSLLLCARLLDALGQYELAVETYKKIPVTSPDYHAAEMGRAEALRRSSKPDAAIEVLERLTVDQPTLAPVYSALGDILRQQDQFAEAIEAYDSALEFSDKEAPARWFLHYARGISHERLKQWDAAEADFRSALEISPDQPQVLNYLGYSLVERKSNLDEALGMIERAVEARPDSGYIVDSLGWVLYRMGRYDEAVGHMETAVQLMPVDAVVTDHLADVYWAVGRKREAEFQWKRALSFIDPEDTDSEADPDRIRRKLEVGLDQVLSEEGSDPLTVVNGEH